MAYSKDFLMKLYRNLAADRILEERLVELYAQGWIPGHIHSGQGEEASYTGVLAVGKEGDQYKFTHRNVSAYHDVGISYNHIFCEILGKKGGNSDGKGGINHIADKDKGVIGLVGALGGTIPVATGVAYALKMKSPGNIVICIYGDGTTSRGTVHESMNWAAVWKLPILFVVNNNQFSISTSAEECVSVPNPGADRASAYGMPAKVVDGTDVLAVYEAAKELSDYVRAGNGPAVLETKVYRWRGHFEGDMARYRDPKVAEEWKKKDCVKKFETYLLDNKVITEEEIEQLRKEVCEEIEAGIKFSEEAPQPEPAEIYDCLYAEAYYR